VNIPVRVESTPTQFNGRRWWWRVIIALARYGGLRTPSETLALQWSYVDWERGRLMVFSPKLERLASGGFRTIPLFPELRAILADAFDAAPEGSVYVINRYRDAKQNLRTQFLRIIRKAGVKPWGRLFHNLYGIATSTAPLQAALKAARWGRKKRRSGFPRRLAAIRKTRKKRWV
jgi:integrase